MLDLWYVNQFILMKKFKYEGLNIVPQLCGKGDFIVTFDLKSSYHHVDIDDGFCASTSEFECLEAKPLVRGDQFPYYVVRQACPDRGCWE